MTYTRDTDKNLLTAIEASIGSQLFRHLYVRDEAGAELDVLEEGELSCAYFVSSLLALAGRMDRPHATVASTVRYFEQSPSWQKTEAPTPGDIICWDAGTHGHPHVGFWIGDGEAVSNSFHLRVPVHHSLELDDGRTPVAYWHYVSKAA